MTVLTAGTRSKYSRLQELLRGMGRVLIAFSGGVDSTFLLKVACEVLGDQVLAVIATSDTYPQKEIKEAVRLAEEMGVEYKVIPSCEMENPDFIKNPPDRCYYCKKELFSQLKEIAAQLDFPFVLDGSNLEDTGDFRPGSKAARELDIRSPLKEAGFLKSDIREVSRMLNLSTWDKPAMACLSSRFPYYSEIKVEALKQIEQAEEYLRSLGLGQLRVRHHEELARIEVPAEDIPRLLDAGLRDRVVDHLKGLGYTFITLDLTGYRTGSLNETLPETLKSGHEEE
jgi:uncharacterized protein